MNKFRLLKADEIECRIAMVKPQGLSLLLYKTARTDANLLDETVGVWDWQNDFKLIDGVLYGGIGIRVNHGGNGGCDNEHYVWKWDAGTESNTEAEKGRASDAFKRAGFKWGIGRELYTAPFIWIPSAKCKIENGKCFEKFEVALIEYDKSENISKLVIINSSSRVEVFKWSAKEKTTETYSGDEKIDEKKIIALTKSCNDSNVPVEYVCELYKVKELKDMTDEQFVNCISNWEKLKASFNERKDS